MATKRRNASVRVQFLQRRKPLRIRRRNVNQFSQECMGMVDSDVTGSALVTGDAGGSFSLSPTRASRVPMHSNHHTQHNKDAS